MIIPPKELAQQYGGSRPDQGIYLKSSHLCLSPDVVALLGEKEQNVYLAYYPEKKQLLLSPVSNTFFTKLHPASQHMLKEKDLRGSKSVALHELLIDQEIPDENRTLSYEFVEKSNLLKIKLG